MSRCRRALARTALLLLGGALWVSVAQAAEVATPPWVSVGYGEIVDRRQLSHSGETVGELLAKLGGRDLPPPGQRPEDRLSHSVLHPLVEPYAFVLPDALDSLRPAGAAAWVEIGSLWDPGAPQPAWVELLRARHYVVEGDGSGGLRAFLPWHGDIAGLPTSSSVEAGAAAWSRAWPVLRLVLAAERRRLAAAGGAAPQLRLAVYPYRHFIERSEFHLGLEPHETTVEDTRPDGLRPPLDMDGIVRFLAGQLRLEGARLEPDGSLSLFGSPTPERPSLLGRPLELSDLAVAWRAVAHGGLAEPYMSLDRGFSPQTSIVNYGGRLRDTSLGMVSLLCDIRFKTFSLGLDIVVGQDVRGNLRQALPEFRTHLERLAAHPDSASLASQNTRLWFYPDSVDLTLSAQGDVLVLRRVRMSAASERVQESGRAVAPWTQATVEAINRDYDALANFFPEMADLDQVVRLLSLATWLRQAAAQGQLVPEVDALLAVELPAQHTPRDFPQLLAFNALPPPGSELAVDAVDRVPVAEALERLSPTHGRPLPAAERFARARAMLDPRQPDHAALLADLDSVDPASTAESVLDRMAFRAERLRMHQRVLATQKPEQLTILDALRSRGEQPRVFSVGIGGLDLGMDKVLARASSNRLDLAGGLGFAAGPAARGSSPVDGTAAPGARQARNEAWRRDPDAATRAEVPAYGAGPQQGHFREVGGTAEARTVLSVYSADSTEARSRRVLLDASGRVRKVERLESLRLIAYALEREGTRMLARRAPVERQIAAATPAATEALPAGLGILEIGDAEGQSIPLRLGSAAGGGRSLEARMPRSVPERLILGREVDLSPTRPLAGFDAPPEPLGELEAMMVMLGPGQRAAPWIGGVAPLAPEQDALRIARALGAWWSARAGLPTAVVGVDPAVSPDRWTSAPRPDARALLLLPEAGFDGRDAALRAALREAWPATQVVEELPARVPSLVVLVGAEPPARFAQRLRRLARDPRMQGKLLAAWPLYGSLRPDLPASLLGQGRLAGVGVAPSGLVERRRAASRLAELIAALRRADGAERVERVAPVWLWQY